MLLHFAGLTKEFLVSSARPAWERIQRGLRGPAPFIVDSAAHPPPRSHKWKQSFVWGEWSRFTVDGLPTKDHATVTTGPGSAAPRFHTLCFTEPLMQTQPLQSLSTHVPQWQNTERTCFPISGYSLNIDDLICAYLLLFKFQIAELHC